MILGMLFCVVLFLATRPLDNWFVRRIPCRHCGKTEQEWRDEREGV